MTTTISFDRARALLTPPPPAPIAYSIDDVERLLGVSYTSQQKQALEVVPFEEDVLRSCAGTHMLFPGFPISLLGLRERRPAAFLAQTGGWYAEEKQAFSRKQVPLCWHLLRIGPLPGSLGISAVGQERLLPPGESIPGVAETAFAAVLHKLATGQMLFGIPWCRTADQTAGGSWVYVYWSGGRLYVSHWGGGARDDVGSASARTS